MVSISDLSYLILIVLDCPLVRHIFAAILLLLIFKVACESPDLLTLDRVIYQAIIKLKTQLMSELNVTSTVNQFDFNHARWVCDVKHYRLVPDRWPAGTLIGLSDRIVLGNFNQVAAFAQVLSIDNMHFELGIVANIRLRIDKLMLVSLCIL